MKRKTDARSRATLPPDALTGLTRLALLMETIRIPLYGLGPRIYASHAAHCAHVLMGAAPWPATEEGARLVGLFVRAIAREDAELGSFMEARAHALAQRQAREGGRRDGPR